MVLTNTGTTWILTIGAIVGTGLALVQLVVLKAHCLLCLCASLILICLCITTLIWPHRLFMLDWFELVGTVGFAVGLGLVETTNISRYLSALTASNRYRNVTTNEEVFKTLCFASLPSTDEAIRQGNSGLLINRDLTAEQKVIAITIVNSCKHCKDFLHALIDLTYISPHYCLLVRVGTKNKVCSFIDINNVLSKYLEAYDRCDLELCYQNNGEVVSQGDSLTSMGQGLLPDEDIINILCSATRYPAYPHICVSDVCMPMIYSPEQLKEHLALLKYY